MCAYESRLINFKFAGLWILTARGLSEKFGSSPKKLVTKGMPGAIEAWKRWPRLQPHWPRIRRRICDQCGRRVALSEPRFLVCGGCAEGRGVGRYCSETCQAEHWPTHQEVCPRIDHASVEARPWLRKMQNYSLIDGVEKAKCAGHSPGDYLDVVAYELAEKYGTIDKMKMIRKRCQ